MIAITTLIYSHKFCYIDIAIKLLILSAVVLFLCIVKTCTVNELLGGNDVRRVRVTNPSDSLAEVLLLSNRTPKEMNKLH